MKKLLTTLLICFLACALSATAQTASPAPQAPTDPETLNRVIAIVVQQRDASTVMAQNLDAQLRLAQDEIAKLKKQVAELIANVGKPPLEVTPVTKSPDKKP